MSVVYGRVKTRAGLPVDVGSFSGGREDGICIQLTPTMPADVLQFTRAQAMKLADLLEDALIATRSPGADR